MSASFHHRFGALPETAAVVEALASAPETRDHVFSDARESLTYADLPARFVDLDEAFAAQGLDPALPVAFECPQSVRGATALLYFLHRNYDLVLLPEVSEGAKEAGSERFIPEFCSHVVSADEASEIHAAPNVDFREVPLVRDFAAPDVYLRTSGSTGRPKLVRMAHCEWWANALGCVERWRLGPEDRLMVPVPIFHSYGFGAAYLPGLLAGASMELLASFNILRYLERETSFEPNVAFLTPALCDMFVRVRRTARSYRLAVTAGDKIKPETVSAFEPRFGPLLNLYGSAEMGAVASASPEELPAARLGTAGHALSGVELRIGEGGEEETAVGRDSVGALLCRSRHAFAGYLYQDEDEGWRFDHRAEDGWFETGDLARIRTDGSLELLGRARLSVKRDGLLVVFADLEARIEHFGAFSGVVVFAAGETPRGPGLVAVCERVEGSLESAEALRKICFARLPRYAVPDDVVLVDALPRLPNGKVDRRAVPILIHHPASS